MRQKITTLAMCILTAAPIAAQQPAKHDPDKKVDGGGLPAGWMGRTDGANARITDVKFVAAGDGYHVTSGPAAIYWTEKGNMSGAFTATVTITQTKAPTHAEAFGVFFAGNKLSAADQTYYYLLVRGDGMFMLNHRAGTEVHKIIPWTANAAVRKADASGVAANTLIVDASKPDSVRMKVNGVQVAALPSEAKGYANGYLGVRVNHNLDVDVSAIKIAR